MKLDLDAEAQLGPGPDADVIAQAVITEGKKRKKSIPTSVDLASTITNIAVTDTIQGSSTLTITLIDDQWDLMDSGFFDANKDGKLDPIDLNYPEDSRLWWRLTQVSPQGSGMVDLVFMERAAVYLMGHHGPYKASRGKRTRAEFLQGLCKKVKAGGGIKFHSTELHKKQPLAKVKKADKAKKREVKGQGINPGEKLTIKGVAATEGQKNQVSRALDVASQLNAPELAVLAMVCAGIGESSFTAVVNSKGYGGVFQGQVETGGRYFKVDDTEEEAESFLKGTKGFQGGGAIKMANSNPHADPGQMATTIEGSGEVANFYGKWKKEAQALIEAYGGGGFGGTTYVKQYNFAVAKTEDFWEACDRIGKQEVNWAFFLDGNRAYFDSEMTLIKQGPIAVISRDDPEVIDWNFTWDNRKIATEMELTLVCDPFEFRAGEVFKLNDFGPASTGSSAKPPLPGRWLIETIEGSRGSALTTFTLKQPEAPKAEPRSETSERSDPSSAGGDITGTPYQIINEVVLPIAEECGIRKTVTQNDIDNHNHSDNTTSGKPSDHKGPKNVAWAADMSNGVSTKEEAKLAQALADKFGAPSWNGHELKTWNSPHGTYRYQLIHNTYEGGDHFNHVHFGVKLIGKLPSNKPSSKQLSDAVK